MNLEDILVSAIVPTYNRKEMVKRTVNSLLDQNINRPYEIIVVDDGSSDDTIEELYKSYLSEIEAGKIKVIQQENGGVGSARNTGIDNAQGKYVAFCDSDDMSLPGRLEEQVNFLEDHSEKRFVHSKALWCDKHGDLLNSTVWKTTQGIPEHYKNNIWPELNNNYSGTIDMLSQEINPIHTSSVMAERELLLNFKQRDGYVFNPHLKNVEDYDFWKKVAEFSLAHGEDIMGFVNSEHIKYTVNGTNKSFADKPRQRKTKEIVHKKAEIRKQYNGKEPKLLSLTPKFTGGIGGVTIGQSEGLFNLGFTNIDFLVQPNWYGQKREFSFKKMDSHILSSKRAPEDPAYYEQKQKKLNGTLEQVLDDINVNDYTAVHIQGNQFVSEARSLKRRGVPMMYTCHSLVKYEDDVENRCRSLAQNKQEEIMDLVDVVQVMSEGYKEILLNYYPHLERKVEVIPNGNSLDLNGYTKKTEPNHILAVGRLDDVKGYEHLIKAIYEVEKKNPNVQLTIAGIGPKKEELERLVSELGLSNKVQLVGWKTKKELKELYSRASLFVQPSLHENWPLTVHDAVAYGVPVVCTNVGGMNKLFSHGKTALKIRPKDPDNIATVLSYALEYPEYMNGLANEAKEDFNTYTWNNVANKLNGVIKKLDSKISLQEPHERSKRDYESAKRYTPQRVKAALQVAKAYGHQSQIGDAEEWINKALAESKVKISQKDPQVEYLLADFFQEIGRMELAGKHFRAAYKFGGENPSVAATGAYRMAKVYFDNDRLEDSEEWCQRALNVNPSFSPAQDLIGKISS